MEIKLNLEPEMYCCEYSLLSDMITTLEYAKKKNKSNYSSIAVLAHEDTIEKLFKAICQVRFDQCDATLLFDYLDYSVDDYSDEYALILTLSDKYTREFSVSIEKAKEDGTYNVFEEDWLYIDEECTDELIKKHLQYEENMDIFYINDECEVDYDDCSDDEDIECDGDCENCDMEDTDEETIDVHEEMYYVIECMVADIMYDKFFK